MKLPPPWVDKSKKENIIKWAIGIYFRVIESEWVRLLPGNVSFRLLMEYIQIRKPHFS